MKITFTDNCPKCRCGYEEDTDGQARIWITVDQDGRYDWDSRLLSRSIQSYEFALEKIEETNPEGFKIVKLEAETAAEMNIFKNNSELYHYREKETDHYLLTSRKPRIKSLSAKNY